MNQQKKVLKTLVIILGIICAIFAIIVITSGVAIMQYRAKIPKIIMKPGVTITEGDTIELEDVADVSDNMIGYLLGAAWVDGNEGTESANIEGISCPDGSSRHALTVEEGSGKLQVYVTAWGTNYEFTGGKTVVTVLPKENSEGSEE